MTETVARAAGPDRYGADLDIVLGGQAPAFALLHRPSVGPDTLEILVGDMVTVSTLADLPLPDPAEPGEPASHDLLAFVPYRQIVERGFACRDDDTPLLAMRVLAQGTATVAEALRRLPDQPVDVRDGAFDIDDDSYAAVVRRVLSDEIGRGEGANFVIRRSFLASIANWSPATALTIFHRLLRQELGAYWTFVAHTGGRTFIGATPERHVSLTDGTVVMNPISGTYRYPASGPTVPGVLRFLADRKEADELYMVADEELKMMGRVCDDGGRVRGPYLKEMARLAHTEYLLEGRSSLDVREILRETMFAPTVTGSPLANACRVISRYEPRGRGYYSGVLALLGRESGRYTLDSSILIRSAVVDADGQLEIGVGATLVRHSDPASEVAETRAKAAGLLAALGATDSATGPRPDHAARRDDTVHIGLDRHPSVRLALASRNVNVARFWLDRHGAPEPVEPLRRRDVLVIDADDTFTWMLGHQLRALGPTVTIRRYDDDCEPDGYDLVVVGPGPGDPRDLAHPKMAKLRGITERLLDDGLPFVSVCLGHQVLGSVLGFELVRRPVPGQGVQREIDYFGQRHRVGFYNTFALRCDADEVGPVQVSRDPATGEVHGLRGKGFRSMQFHPESILTQHGPEILTDALTSLLRVETLAV